MKANFASLDALLVTRTPLARASLEGKRWAFNAAIRHAEADVRCKRVWSCACGPCRFLRADPEGKQAMAELGFS